MLSPLEQKVWDLLAPMVADHDLRLVRVRLSGGEEASKLQIMIEPLEANRDNRTSVRIEQCEAVSREASALLDVADPISQAYTLEVSSTGLERPLVQLDDFRLYAPHRVRLEARELIDGRRRFDGILHGVTDADEITLQLEDGTEPATVQVPYEAVKSARLAYTETELKKALGL